MLKHLLLGFVAALILACPALADEAANRAVLNDAVYRPSAGANLPKIEKVQLLLGVGGAPGGTLRFVATRNLLPNSSNGAIHSTNSLITKTAATNLKTVQIVIPAYLAGGGGGETAVGAAQTEQACIEYPSGSGTIVGVAKFSGSATGSVSSPGTLVSDLLTLSVTIPAGANFEVGVTEWDGGSGGVAYTGSAPHILNDNFEYGVSIVTPITSICTGAAFGGTGTSSAGASALVTAAFVIAVATTPADVGIGDSIMEGFHDTIDSYFRSGEIFKSYPTTRTFLNLGDSGYRAGRSGTNTMGALFSERNKLIGYGSNYIYNLAHNNYVGGGQSAATTQANMEADFAFIRTKNATANIVVATPLPEAASTDFWTTTGNQTTDGTNSVRATLVTTIKAIGMAGQNNFFDTAGAIEFGTGLFQVSGQTQVADAVATVTAFSSASYTFTSADVGNAVVINGAGAAGAKFQTTFASVTPPHSATLASAVTTNVSGATAFLGTVTTDAIHLQPNSYAAVSTTAVNFGLIP